MNWGMAFIRFWPRIRAKCCRRPPLTLAETASVFGEMLTFRAMLDAAETQEQRKILLAGKVEDMINTVVRQIAFYDFECKLHAPPRRGGTDP